MVTAELSQFYILMSSIIASSFFAHYFFKFSTYKNNNVETLKKLLITYIIIVSRLNKFLIYSHITYPLHRLSTIYTAIFCITLNFIIERISLVQIIFGKLNNLIYWYNMLCFTYTRTYIMYSIIYTAKHIIRAATEVSAERIKKSKYLRTQNQNIVFRRYRRGCRKGKWSITTRQRRFAPENLHHEHVKRSPPTFTPITRACVSAYNIYYYIYTLTRVTR